MGKDVKIGDFSVIGFSDESRPSELLEAEEEFATSLGDGVIVHSFSTIYEGAKLGACVELDSYSRIGYNSRIGPRTKIVYGAKIYDEVAIGRRCIVSGFCCDGSKIGDGTTMMGNLVHKARSPISVDDWDAGPQTKGAPAIGRNVFIGFNSIIVGPVTIGDDAKVGAGAVVLENVDKGATVIGVPAKEPLDKVTRRDGRGR